MLTCIVQINAESLSNANFFKKLFYRKPVPAPNRLLWCYTHPSPAPLADSDSLSQGG